MQQHEVRERLQAVTFSRNFSASMIDALSTIAEWRTFARGQFVFHEGDLQHKMCVPAGECQRLLTVGPGELLAWSALLGGGKMTASAICQEDVEVIALDSRNLQAICERDHDFGYAFMRQVASSLSKRLLCTRLQMLDIFAPPTKE
jgi:CRP-like cAMP-binding protein